MFSEELNKKNRYEKHILLFLSIFSLVAFSGCDDRDEIRDDINALSARLDALQVEFDKLNSNINTFYNLANGKLISRVIRRVRMEIIR